MRTLKKALSLVLVLAMVLSLGVSAFAVEKAADYSDYADVKNTEAVAVLTALKVLEGNDDGTFGPEGAFTRAAAAKIICYMTLGATTAEALPAGATQFSDVPATHWASKYIQYCANAKIILGNGDGTFGPDATLTASAWSKMLLCALGYDAATEGMTGTGWEINVTRLAMNAKVASAEDMAGTFNRDAAAKMAFNTLKANMVYYKTSGTSITIGDTTINTGASAAEKVAIESEGAANYAGAAGAGVGYQQFCEAHFDKLKVVDNGNGTHTWTNGVNVTVGTFANSSTTGKTYTGVTTAAQLYTDGVKKAAAVSAYVNGKLLAGYTVDDLKVVRGDTTAANYNFTQFVGATITLMTNANGEVNLVSVVKPYLAEVVKVYPATASKDAYTQLKVYKDSSTGATAYVAGDTFAKGDFVLYAPTNDTLVNTTDTPDSTALVLQKADSFVSTVSAYNTTKENFTADGTTYQYSSAAKKLVAINTMDVKNGTTYTFYKDLNGTIIGAVVASEGTSTLNYVYVSQSTATAKATDLLGTAVDAFKVKVTYLDGKTEVLDYALKTATAEMTGAGVDGTIAKGATYFVAPNGTKTGLAAAVTDTSGSPISEGLYSYTIDSEGKVTLSNTLTSTGTNPTTADEASTSVVVNKGKAQVTVDGTTMYATKDTKLVLAKGETVTTYTGYNEFPTTATYAAASYNVVYVTTGETTKTISNILVVGATAAVDTTPDSFAVYVGAGDNTSAGQQYNFFVNGEVKSYLLSTDNTVAAGSLVAKTVYGLTLDKDGKAVLTDVSAKTVTGKVVTAVTDAYLAVTDGVYYVKDAYTAYDIAAAVTSASTWVDADVEVGDTLTIVYKYDATAGVNNILAVFVTANVVA